MKINRFAAVLMALCLMAGSALATQLTIEVNDGNGVITAVEFDSGSDMLVIPNKVKNEIGEDVPVTGITADFSGCNGLKYILFEGFTRRNFPKVDLTAALDLECVYFTLEVTGTIKERVTVNENVELLQRIDLSDKYLALKTPEYANDNVTIQFPNILPDGYSGYGYRITREPIGNSGIEEVFDSSEGIRFDISNGMVTFTDDVKQTTSQQSYRYTVMAYEPFGSSITAPSVDVTIPAQPAPDPEDPEPDPEPEDPEANPDPEDPKPEPDPEDPQPGPEPADPEPVPAPAEPDTVPTTGDEAAPLLWAALIAMSAIGMTALRKRKQA